MGTRSRTETRIMTDLGSGRILAAFASLGAAAIHFASAPDHYAEWLAAGVFFYAVGVFQAGWALAALRASGPAVMVLGFLANAGVIATWAVSRTEGMPFGPHTGVPEEVSRVGVTATAFEAVVCLVALFQMRRRDARGFASSFGAVVLVGLAGALVTGLTMPAVDGAMNHTHGAGEDSPSHHGGEHGTHEEEHGETGPGASPEESATPSPEASPSSEPAEEDPADGHGHDDGGHGH